jgi:hypothetical protein
LPDGSIATMGFQGDSLVTTSGWDNVTGLGVPNGATFLDAMKP